VADYITGVHTLEFECRNPDRASPSGNLLQLSPSLDTIAVVMCGARLVFLRETMISKRIFVLTLAIGAMLLPGSAAFGQALKPLPFVSPIFGDNMVLQRGKPNAIWGWSEPGETVRVEIAGEAASAVAGPDRRWQVRIQPPPGLVVKGSKLQEFAVAGENRTWHWADARIEGETVIVSSSAVPEPQEVRYAWQSNPAANLFNGAGLPASPFRTDTWPGITEGRRPY
jgi:hypothetical protein